MSDVNANNDDIPSGPFTTPGAAALAARENRYDPTTQPGFGDERDASEKARANETAAAREAAKTPREREIDAIRANPDFWRTDGDPTQKALVQRLKVLLAEDEIEAKPEDARA